MTVSACVCFVMGPKEISRSKNISIVFRRVFFLLRRDAPSRRNVGENCTLDPPNLLDMHGPRSRTTGNFPTHGPMYYMVLTVFSPSSPSTFFCPLYDRFSCQLQSAALGSAITTASCNVQGINSNSFFTRLEGRMDSEPMFV